MDRKEVLTKAIAIAKRNGFDVSDDFFTEIPAETWLQEGQDLYFSLIFAHDFAISFFGEHTIVVEEHEEDAEEVDMAKYENPMILLMANRGNIKIPAWQFHLIQMMLYPDPLEYIYNFIKDYEQAALN